MDDVPRINAFLKETVDVSLIWREISQNLDAFTSETVFDGGVKIGALISPKCDAESFAVNWRANFTKPVREIRNALSHGRDQKTTCPITPTTANFNRLAPWVALTHIAASQVVVYEKKNVSYYHFCVPVDAEHLAGCPIWYRVTNGREYHMSPGDED